MGRLGVRNSKPKYFMVSPMGLLLYNDICQWFLFVYSHVLIGESTGDFVIH